MQQPYHCTHCNQPIMDQSPRILRMIKNAMSRAKGGDPSDNCPGFLYCSKECKDAEWKTRGWGIWSAPDGVRQDNDLLVHVQWKPYGPVMGLSVLDGRLTGRLKAPGEYSHAAAVASHVNEILRGIHATTA